MKGESYVPNSYVQNLNTFVLMGAAIFKLVLGATLTGVLKAERSNLVYK